MTIRPTIVTQTTAVVFPVSASAPSMHILHLFLSMASPIIPIDMPVTQTLPHRFITGKLVIRSVEK